VFVFDYVHVYKEVMIYLMNFFDILDPRIYDNELIDLSTRSCMYALRIHGNNCLIAMDTGAYMI